MPVPTALSAGGSQTCNSGLSASAVPLAPGAPLGHSSSVFSSARAGPPASRIAHTKPSAHQKLILRRCTSRSLFVALSCLAYSLTVSSLSSGNVVSSNPLK